MKNRTAVTVHAFVLVVAPSALARRSPPPNVQTPHAGRGAGRPDFLLPGSWWGCHVGPALGGLDSRGIVVNVEVPRTFVLL